MDLFPHLNNDYFNIISSLIVKRNKFIIEIKIMSNNLSDLLHKITFNTNPKIGSTTTVNEQVD